MFAVVLVVACVVGMALAVERARDLDARVRADRERAS